ncbi:MAG TPA: MASE1 domain-containing protein [Thermoleophilaceae bacterium]|nr:MASE1 domain-containing protein [Thermoleophilaceae bacterium]
MMRLVAATAAFASVYFLVAVLTRPVTGHSGLAVLWPASGVYLGVMLVAPRRMWSALACGAWIGSLAAYLHAGSSLEVSVAFAVPSSAEGLLGALLVERIAGRRLTLRGLQDVFALVLGGAVVATALVGLSAGAVAAQTFGVSFGESWLRWWSADALGVIAVAPIITAPLRPRGLRAAAVGGLGVALVVTRLADAQLYTVQALLAVLLLSWLALAVALTERERALAEREQATEKLDEAGRRVAQLGAELATRSAELATRSAELHEAGRRRERLTEQIRTSQASGGRTERELVDARTALAEVERRLSALGGDLTHAVAERDRVQRELDESALAVGRLQAKLGDAADELANARAAGRALEGELRNTRARQARTSEQLAAAMSARQRVEQEQERLGTRAETLRSELERTQRAHGDANEALEHGRAQFAAQRRALEEELEGAVAERARTSEQLAEAISGRQRVEQELERLGARVETLRAELERTQRAHGQANQALVQGRAQFAEQRQRLERSLEEATELSSRYDDRGTCLDASPAFCRLLGYEREELVGRAGAELLHVEDRPRLVRARATRSDTIFEARLRRKAGDFVWVEVSLHPVCDGPARRLVEIKTTVRAVSEERAATQTAA